MLARWVEAFGDRLQIELGGQGLTYRQVEAQSSLLARGLLARGAGKGTPVGLLMPNGPDWIVAWMAITRIGAIAVQLSTFSKADELARTIRHSDIQTLLTADNFLNHDYVERLEAALPSLATAGGQPLKLREAPYLRSIWIWGEARPAWATGDRAGLEAAAESGGYDAGLLAAVEAQVAPSDPAVMIYTSGSTAEAKAVVHSHGSVVRQSLLMSIYSAFEPGDRMLLSQPLFWVGGLCTSLLSANHAGAALICPPRPSSASALSTIRERGVTQMSMWPAQVAAIMAEPDFKLEDFAGLRPNSSQQLSFYKLIPPGRSPGGLGMTETFGPHSLEMATEVLPEHRAGAFGRAVPGFERRIIDPDTGEELPPGELGELCLRGGSLMLGFHKKERADTFERDGFYRTGDLCRIMEDGYLFMQGRLGDMIKTSGANVSPGEVERVLMQNPAIRTAIVTGLPDPVLGEIVVAAVVLNPGAHVEPAALQAELSGQISSYKVPRRIVFFDYDDLPWGASGKIIKPRLKELLQKAEA
jgi:acyl-CoA synthetase (AMP-forming)/AMP-acid ligase II